MAEQRDLTPGQVLLLAVATGIVVANLNYLQPIEAVIAQSYHVSDGVVGAIAMMTQFGYAVGLLSIVPLGDVLKRDRFIRNMMLLSIVALLAAFWAPTITAFAVASTLVGMTSVAPQILIPYAAYLASPLKRGRVLGDVLSGLLVGILVSRSVSGVLASFMDWHAVYLIAAVVILCLWAILGVALPKDQRPKPTTTFAETLRSLPSLWRQSPTIRAAAVNGFVLFGVSNMFWTTNAFYLSSPVYHLGSQAAGLLGLLGIAGILAAPMIGRAVDTYQPRPVISLGLAASTLAYLIFALMGQWLLGLMIGVVVLDLGTQLGQVANQARVQAINPAASNRLNSLFMFAYFLGGSLGALLGTTAWSFWGWNGVCVAALAMLIVGALAHFVGDRH